MQMVNSFFNKSFSTILSPFSKVSTFIKPNFFTSTNSYNVTQGREMALKLRTRKSAFKRFRSCANGSFKYWPKNLSGKSRKVEGYNKWVLERLLPYNIRRPRYLAKPGKPSPYKKGYIA
eukprot:TRINITY_DN2341_c1_g3_i1.p1 TRINITY_DN2341_c1_g3~~TRINITY_DN2341_c1_g3_i1.p1  ORF type:complete len:137 (-),score=48.02 TRINITY_DN2341_c1_g3_i1:128-484(-)